MLNWILRGGPALHTQRLYIINWVKYKERQNASHLCSKNWDKSGHIVNFLENATKSDQDHLKKYKDTKQRNMIGVVEKIITSRDLGA